LARERPKTRSSRRKEGEGKKEREGRREGRRRGLTKQNGGGRVNKRLEVCYQAQQWQRTRVKLKAEGERGDVGVVVPRKRWGRGK